jgi:hypothetical protein
MPRDFAVSSWLEGRLMHALLRFVSGGAAGAALLLAAGVARADGAEAPDVTVQPAAPVAQPQVAPPNLADWPEGAAPPPGYHWVQKPRLGPLIGGASLLGATWAISAFVGSLGYDFSQPHDASYLWLDLPVAGPFVELTHSGSATASVFLVVDGVAQFAGLALLVYGISVPVVRLERNEAATAIRLAPVPLSLGKNGGGLGVVGTF